VFTFNDEIACRKKTVIDFEGTIPAAPLLAILEKLPDEKLEVDTSKSGEIMFRGKRKKFRLTHDVKILLPIGQVSKEKPEVWHDLPESFKDVINNVKDCCSNNEDNFNLTCLHIHPEFVEACNGCQLIRWYTKFGLAKPVLIRGLAVSHVVGLDMDRIAETENWIHFRNSHGLILSCRKFVEDYPTNEISEAIKIKGEEVTLPKSLGEAADRAAIMAGENTAGQGAQLLIRLRKNEIIIIGQGLIGEYEESKKAEYSGPEIRFGATPVLLQSIAKSYTHATINERMLKASGGSAEKTGRWVFASTLMRPKKSDEGEPEETEGEEETEE
jgi:DNA polymerase III sliding clamp (beta) subunit (PCNA family)